MRTIVVATSLALLSGHASALEVADPERSLRFTVPAGFADFPDGRKQPRIIHSFARNLGQPSFLLVAMEDLGGTIGRESLDVSGARKTLPPEMQTAKIEPLKMKWKSFEVEGMRLVAKQEDVELVVLVLQIPLKPSAVQLVVTGELANEREVRATIDGVLGSLDGPTNWLTRDERIGRAVQGGTQALVLLGGIGFAIWWRRRKARGSTASSNMG
jgi:hypothetical protein